MGCSSCALPFRDPLPIGVKIYLAYETKRWLPEEPISTLANRTNLYRDASVSSTSINAEIEDPMREVKSF
jgi:hypothetical protein